MTSEELDELERTKSVSDETAALAKASPLNDALAGRDCAEFVAWIDALEKAAPSLIAEARFALKVREWYAKFGEVAVACEPGTCEPCDALNALLSASKAGPNG